MAKLDARERLSSEVCGSQGKSFYNDVVGVYNGFARLEHVRV